MKHIVCYSGGHSSALVAVEVVRRYGVENVILVNHDIHFNVEDSDIKRFKNEVAAYLKLDVTYVNYKNAALDQFDVCVQEQAFKIDDGSEICTNRLKIRPFMGFLKSQFSDRNAVIYYGFDANEQARIQRRTGVMGALGYRTEYPLAFWERSISNIEELGIARPQTYSQFKHGNCVGCLKAGQQHWYIVYCTRPDIWLKAKWAEDEIGYSILHNADGPLYLEGLESKFELMKRAGVPQTEHIAHQTFWAKARKFIREMPADSLPCECSK